MSRVIKFRIYDSAKKEYFYFNLNDINFESQGFVDPDGTVEQFTGLHDVNGREIYEGDILKWKIPCFRGGDITENGYKIPEFTSGSGKIEFVEFAYFAVSKRKSIHNILSGDQPKHIKVIGNIHENPELMEGGE